MRCALTARRSAFARLATLPLLVGAVLFCFSGTQEARAVGFAVDASVNTHQSTAARPITSAPLTTTSANDHLVAFVASDGPKVAGGQSFSSVAGGGFTWTLRGPTNAQPGTAGIWEAVAPRTLNGVTVTATRTGSPFEGSISVVAFTGQTRPPTARQEVAAQPPAGRPCR